MIGRATLIKGLKAARQSELKAFKPPLDFLPLFTVFGAALSTVAYCSYRALALNPDVHLTAAHKHDELAESGITAARAERYWDSIFRRVWLARVHDADQVDARIHL